MPASASSVAVPPVEMISTPRSLSARAKSTTPRLSNTDTSARSTFSSPSSVGGCSAAASLPLDICALVDQDEPRIALVESDLPACDQADRAGEQLVLCLVQDRQDVLLAASVGKRNRVLQDDRTGVYPVVHEVDRNSPHLYPVGDLVFDRVGSGKGWQQRRMDVDHTAWELTEERGVEELHESGEHDELDVSLLQPFGHHTVALGSAREGSRLEDAGLDLGVLCACQRPDARLAAGDGRDLDPVASVDLVEDRLEVRPGP